MGLRQVLDDLEGTEVLSLILGTSMEFAFRPLLQRIFLTGFLSDRPDNQNTWLCHDETCRMLVDTDEIAELSLPILARFLEIACELKTNWKETFGEESFLAIRFFVEAMSGSDDLAIAETADQLFDRLSK
jgi:hypothetical protein